MGILHYLYDKKIGSYNAFFIISLGYDRKVVLEKENDNCQTPLKPAAQLHGHISDTFCIITAPKVYVYV